MENESISDVGLRLKNVILLESNFVRADIIDQEGKQAEYNIDISVRIDPAHLLVTLNTSFTKKREEKVQFDFNVKMLGLFDIVGEPMIDYQEFGQVNAAAIIFPFVREHISSLGTRSGLGLIMLPMINFVELRKRKS